MTRQAGILTVSDTRSQGIRADRTTAMIRRLLEEAGFAVCEAVLVPDELPQIQRRLIEFADRLKLALIVTTGGTGLGPRDVTPEAIRTSTAAHNPLAWLSRGVAGLRGRSLILNLPGSPQGVQECLRVALPLLPHALAMVEGRSHGHRTVAAGS